MWKNGSERWNAGKIRADNATKQLAARFEEYEENVIKLAKMKANTSLSYAEEMERDSIDFMLPVMKMGLEQRKVNLTIALNFLNSSRVMLDEGKIKLDDGEKRLREGKAKLDAASAKLNKANQMLWTVTTTIFVIGGLIGSFTSKFVADRFGRKKAIVFHYTFGVIAGIFTIIAPYIRSPVCVMIGRLLFGVQAGC
jgi:hypothetical protein